MTAVMVSLINHFPKGSLRQSLLICLPLPLLAFGVTAYLFSPAQKALFTEGDPTSMPSFLNQYLPLVLFSVGICTWTLLEYLLHRFLLHWTPIGSISQALLNRLHIHHHRDPSDESVVCLPFLLCLPLWGIGFALIYALAQAALPALWITTGIATMMVLYDVTHYGVHYWNLKNRIFKLLKRNHMLHHFTDSTKRFGVTTTFWDYVFRTRGKSPESHSSGKNRAA